MFSHLERVNQSYSQHFFDAILFSLIAFKASMYFFVHALWPDIFEVQGSREIDNLKNILDYKRRKFEESL